MVSHTRLQYYNINLCLVCLTGLLGCRWHRYKQSTDQTKKRDLACFTLLVLTVLYITFFFYYWLMTGNYADWMNSYLYDNTGNWYKYYSLVFIVTCVTFSYILLVLLLALCHVGQGYELYMHWVHKILIVLTIAACVAATLALDSVWKGGWSLQTLSLRITGPFLHVSLVAVITVLSWLIIGQWMTLSKTAVKVLWLCVYLTVMAGLYMAPIFIDSPCVVQSRDLPPQPAVLVHGGASALAPENTMIAFQLAANYTNYGFETDLTVSMDGVPFLLHDTNLRRTTNVDAVFPDRASQCGCMFNMSELSLLDAGSWFVKRNPLGELSKAPLWARSQYNHQKVAPLSDLLEFMKGTKRKLMFDIKFEAGPSHPHFLDYPDIVINTILQSGFPPEQILWLYQDKFNLSSASQFTAVAPGGQHDIQALKAAGIRTINAEHSMLSLDDIQYYHRHNISTNIYLVNSAWLYSLYWCAGVQSVTSNFVHRLTGMTAPVWHLSPAQFQAMWITTNVLSALLVIAIFVIQRIRHSSRSFHPEPFSLEGARYRMDRLRRSRNMREKLLRTADTLQEVDAGDQQGIVGMSTPAVVSRFQHVDSATDANRYSGMSGLSEEGTTSSGDSTNRFSGISGLSAISGVVTMETDPDTRYSGYYGDGDVQTGIRL